MARIWIFLFFMVGPLVLFTGCKLNTGVDGTLSDDSGNNGEDSGSRKSPSLAPNPTQLQSSTNSTGVDLNWSSGGTGTDGYLISYQEGLIAPASCDDGTKITQGQITGTFYQLTGLDTNKHYSVRICAVNSIGDISTGVTSSFYLGLEVTHPAISSQVALTSQVIQFEFTNSFSTSISAISLTSTSFLYSESANTCSGTIAAGATCQIDVTFVHPTGTENLTLDFTYTQTGSHTYSEDVTITGTLPGAPAVSAVYPTNGANWMDYVQRSDLTKTENAQTDTVCPTGYSATATYASCIHGGEKRKVRTGQSSCTGLTLTETLDAFDWKCEVDSSGEAYFYSNYLKLGKGLRDLISANAFINNSVSITKNATTIVTTPSAAWWSNTIATLPDSTASRQTLSTSGNIYTQTANLTSYGYTVSAAKIGIIISSAATMSPHASIANCNGASTKCLIYLSSANFGWLEGNFNGNGVANQIILLNGVNYYYKLINSNFYRALNYGISNTFGGGFNFSTLINNRFANFATAGFKNDTNFYGNLIWLNSSYNNGFRGFELWSAGLSRLFQTVAAYNGTQGIYMKYGGSVQASTAASNSSYGVYYDYTTEYAFTSHFLSVNNGNSNVYTYNSMNIPGRLFSQVATSNKGNSLNELNTMQISATAFDKFTNYLLLGEAVCAATAAGPEFGGFEVPNCTTTGADGSNTYSTNVISNATIKVGGDFATAFGGQTTDTVNTHGGVTALTSITDWVKFENIYRVWGVNNSVNNDLSGSYRGRCTAGNCGIWNLIPSGTSSPYYRSTGDGTNGSAPAFTASATCPSTVSGNSTTMTIETTPRAFLTNAAELPFSPFGNHDGLCESNEYCLYLPNFGAYQGTGDFWSNQCNFVDGTITGVKMYAYPTN